MNAEMVLRLEASLAFNALDAWLAHLLADQDWLL